MKDISSSRPRSNSVTLTRPHSQAYKRRRLTVLELERYIRGGCFCSVCEFARAEIHARQ